MNTTVKQPLGWAQTVLGVMASSPPPLPWAHQKANICLRSPQSAVSHRHLRVPGNQAVSEDGERETYSTFFSTHVWFPLPHLVLKLFPAPDPPPLLYPEKSYWPWEGQPHPPSSGKPPPNPPPFATLSFLPTPHICTQYHPILALTDRLFRCLPLFGARSMWSPLRSWGAMARARCQTSV